MAARAAVVGTAASAELAADSWTVEPRRATAHEAFLASDALQVRASATRDEAIAAAYVASQFQANGLTPAPGMGDAPSR